VIGALRQRANSWDQFNQVVCVAAVVALVVVAAATPFARFVVSLVTIPFLVWWVYSRFQRTRCWLHLADPSELRVTGPGCEPLSVLRADVVDAYVVEDRHWSDFWMLPRPQRVHVCLVRGHSTDETDCITPGQSP
jgi:hypothetical protein